MIDLDPEDLSAIATFLRALTVATKVNGVNIETGATIFREGEAVGTLQVNADGATLGPLT